MTTEHIHRTDGAYETSPLIALAICEAAGGAALDLFLFSRNAVGSV